MWGMQEMKAQLGLNPGVDYHTALLYGVGVGSHISLDQDYLQHPQ